MDSDYAVVAGYEHPCPLLRPWSLDILKENKAADGQYGW